MYYCNNDVGHKVNRVGIGGTKIDDNDDEGGGSGGRRRGKRGEDNFLADLELSFLLFLHLECYLSLEYWRDVVLMCSLAMNGTTNDIDFHRSWFYRKLLSMLRDQLSCIEMNFFREEVKFSSGDDDFLIGALCRLYDACECIPPPLVGPPSVGPTSTSGGGRTRS